MLPGSFPDVVALVRAEQAAEVAAGFPRLSRIPCTTIIKWLDHYATLPPSEQDALLHANAKIGALRFYRSLETMREIGSLGSTDPALQALTAAHRSRPFTMGLRYWDLRMARSILKDPESVARMAQTRAKLDLTPRDDPPPQIVPDPDILKAVPATTAFLRKLIDPAFKLRYAATKKKAPGGETEYHGTFEGTKLKVRFDYAKSGKQFSYEIDMSDETETTHVNYFFYELLWGGGGDWDWVTEENAEISITLLCDLVDSTVRLFRNVEKFL